MAVVADPTSEESVASGFLDARLVVPAAIGLGLLSAAPLLWVGTHGSTAGLLVLFYGGILGIVIGAVLAFVVGVFVLGTISLAGIAWLALERSALVLGPSFGWGALALVAVGLLLLPAPYRRARDVAAARRAWKQLKGGSVPP